MSTVQNKLIPNNTAINEQYQNIIQDNINLLNDNIKPIIQNEMNKIVSIDEQIDILNVKAGIVRESKKLQEILSKYITFLEYIKKIIQVKIIKDITIVKLIKDVFEKVNEVIEKTNDSNYGIYTSIKNNAKKNAKKNELEQLRKSKKSKIYLVDIGDIKYKNDITQLENCTESIKTELNTAIKEFNRALQPIEGGAPKNTYSLNDETNKFYNVLTNQTEKVFDKINSAINSIDATELNNEKTGLINKYTENLVSIKQKYEEGLNTNIADFEAICKALEELINKIKEITEILSNKKLQVINLNKKDEEELQRQIDALREQDDPVTIKGLKISDFEDAKVFTENHIALVGNNGKSGLLGEIKNKQSELKGPSQNPAQVAAQVQQVQQDQGQDSNNAVSTISNVSIISDDIQNILNEINPIDINELENITDDTFADLEQITKKMRELQDQEEDVTPDVLEEVMQGDVPTTQIKQQNIITQNVKPQNVKLLNVIPSNQHNKYNRIVERINNADSRVKQISIFIYVMKKFTNADKIKKALNKAVRDKDLFTGTSKIVLQTINTANGGKYKMKKSKKSKSKSKASKTTSKKAKSTKKPKTKRTQTKSYNNPKYKNQDGGFVRGGVLFPESFYRSDIVM